MDAMPSVHIVTIRPPDRYSRAQIEMACAIAQALDRGRLVLCEPPRL